ncbi:MAG: conjugal transfer protein TraF [Alphaproteobacteria bacterium]|nr:conjugal transfer protein TraF [Alphaproteobacteria bacterium]OJV13872.1 MAG: hypothetical protein BGO27_08250 [Alphaproteobacteria bacterium 33-17]
MTVVFWLDYLNNNLIEIWLFMKILFLMLVFIGSDAFANDFYRNYQKNEVEEMLVKASEFADKFVEESGELNDKDGNPLINIEGMSDQQIRELGNELLAKATKEPNTENVRNYKSFQNQIFDRASRFADKFVEE